MFSNMWRPKVWLVDEASFSEARFSTPASTSYIWKWSNLVPRHLCGYLVRAQYQNLPLEMENTQHGERQEAVGAGGGGGIWAGGENPSSRRGTMQNTWGRAFSFWHNNPDLVPVTESRLFLCFISWLLICKRLGTDCLSTDPALQVPGNGAGRTLPQALPGWLLLSPKWASLYLSVCIIQD